MLSTEGEPLSSEEMEEMLNSAVDHFDGRIYYDVGEGMVFAVKVVAHYKLQPHCPSTRAHTQHRNTLSSWRRADDVHTYQHA